MFLARCEAEKTVNPTSSVSPRPAAPADALTPVRNAVPAGGVVATDFSTPEVEVQPSGSSATPVHVVHAEPVHEPMPLSPAKRETVLGLPTPSAIPAAMLKSRKRLCANLDVANKRRCTKDSEAGPLPGKASGSGLASRHRAKICFERKHSPLFSVCVSIVS
ncbi:hypothetical protein Bca101_020388 [Brassica carinata]